MVHWWVHLARQREATAAVPVVVGAHLFRPRLRPKEKAMTVTAADIGKRVTHRWLPEGSRATLLELERIVSGAVPLGEAWCSVRETSPTGWQRVDQYKTKDVSVVK
jgi:hypothetical protein